MVYAVKPGDGSAREQAPFERTFQQPEKTEVKNENTEIQLGDKAVILSETGQILYTVPLSESSLVGEHDYNEEIQTRDGWTYYLPCPERKDSQLSKVHPSLYHTLYRSDSDQEIEVIAQDVDNFTFWEDADPGLSRVFRANHCNETFFSHFG